MFVGDAAGQVTSSELLGELARLTWEGIALGLGYGLLSMALIQLVKDMYLRRAFNRDKFDRWIAVESGAGASTSRESADVQALWNLAEQKKNGVPSAAVSPTEPGPAEDFNWNETPDPRTDLVNLAAAGDEDALFGLPIEKMAGQINVAVNAVLESPATHRKLLRKLAQGASEADLALLIRTDSARLRRVTDSAMDAELRFNYADARTRVSHRIQRTIDMLQLSASQRWTRVNRLLSLLISTCIGFLPIFLAQWLRRRYGFFAVSAMVPSSIALSLIGGCLAPLLRDLSSKSDRAG